MQKILFALILYCFSFFSAEAVHYYAWKQSQAEAPLGAFPNALDAASLDRGQSPEFKSVVLITRSGSHGSGILIDPPEGLSDELGDLRGRLILTAAHVIREGQGEINVYLDGFKPGQDHEDGLEELVPCQLAVVHKDFEMGKEDKRQFDYGLVILKERMPGVEPLQVPEAGVFAPDFLSPDIEIVGFGMRYDENAEARSPIDEGLQKRFFRSYLNKRYPATPNILGLNFAEFMGDKGKEIFFFPYVGDSGGPIFIPGDYAQILGIVSGPASEREYKYIHVTKADVAEILMDGKKINVKTGTVAETGK
ncbi:MAG: S1 family peptidase [Alphaproteobacteria bacterium]|nr:S1 family peptidase [Alphaproteobacteria bacterium]